MSAVVGRVNWKLVDAVSSKVSVLSRRVMPALAGSASASSRSVRKGSSKSASDALPNDRTRSIDTVWPLDSVTPV